MPAPSLCKPRPPAAYFALGKASVPEEFTLEGKTYRLRELFKHDFFAATGLYERAADGQFAVLKIQRTHHYYGFPMRWLGRILANHEVAVYERLQGIQGIPEFLGRFGDTGLLHAFVPGHDLFTNGEVGPEFFDDLSRLFEEIHDRKVAYVDANKRENILHGEDGRPWLIDFQISCIYPNPFFGILSMNPLGRYITRRCIRADWYHFYKHKTRMVPAACTPEEFEKAKCPGVWHRLHRFFARPVIQARRRLLSRYDLAKTR
ncbi:MAG TPA: hypothetical protein VM008_10965 [Phycisphaerae bacterium]|nr:hypothetical protein [Phycisphaerae bacterium]